MKEKVFLRTDLGKQDRLNAEALRVCRLINDRVCPVLQELGLFEKSKAIYYAEDCDRVFNDYKKKNLKGIESVSPYLRRIAEEKADNDIYSALGDGWGTNAFNTDVLNIVQWRVTENGEQLTINTKVLADLCKIYVEPEEEKAYNELQDICNKLNAITAHRGLTGYEHVIFCPVGGLWQVNGNINLKAFV